MIETICLRNYRGHTDTTIRCARFTVLVGENACGKTSVLRAVQWVSDGFKRVLEGDSLRRGATELSIQLIGSDGPTQWKIDAVYQPSKAPEELEQKSATMLNGDGSTGRRPHALLLTLNPGDLAATSATSAWPRLAPSGAGLATVLANLKLIETARFDRIVEQLCAVVPIVKGLGFARTEVANRTHDILLFDFVDAARVPASQVSEGTLLTLGVLTALETLDRGENDEARGVVRSPVAVLLIDDVDRALHPRAQRAFVAVLRRMLDANPDLQIIATSHSPYLVDAMKPEEVVVLGRNPNGAVVAKRLDEFPDGRLVDMLSTGELWMSEGDDWVSQ